MIACPNKKSKEWNDLSSKLGEDRAMLAFIRNKAVIPSVKEARELITNKGLLKSLQTLPVMTKESILDTLRSSGVIEGPSVKQDGKDYYPINQNVSNIGEVLGKFTTEYGTVLDYLGTDYLTINEKGLANWNNVANAQSLRNSSVTQLAKDFLTRIGVSIVTQNDVIEKFGSNGVADFAERMVRIQTGMEDQALPEEALHFFLDMMPQDHPALIEALDKIRNTKIYKDTVAQYKDNPNYRIDGQVNFTKIKKEALAKQLAYEMKQKEKTGWVENIIRAIIDWISGVKIKKTANEILQDMFYAKDITLLNTNLNSTEIYNQLTDGEKAFYEAQPMNEEQKETLKNVLAFSSNTSFEPETHTYKNARLNATNEMKSVTKAIGSDYYGELEGPAIIREIVLNFEDEFPGVVEPFEDEAIKSKKLADHVMDLILQDKYKKEDLEDAVGKKIGDLLFKGAEAKAKTLFGTSIHTVVESIILDKDLDLDSLMNDTKLDSRGMLKQLPVSRFMDRKTFERLVYGSSTQPGLLDTIRKIKQDGSVLVSELPVSNGELAGTFDILAIKPDGTVEIYDFKTKYIKNFGDKPSIKKDIIDQFNSDLNTNYNTGIKDEPGTFRELISTTRTPRVKYSQQLSIYKKLLMQAGIKVGKMHVIGVPYRLDNTTKNITEIKVEMVDDIPYDALLANYHFEGMDPSLDATAKKKIDRLEDDKRIAFIEKIEKDKLKEAFAKSLAKVTQLYKKFGKTKVADALYEMLGDQKSKSNKLELQKNVLESTLQNYEDFENFTSIQKNFLELIDSSVPIVKTAMQRFEDLKKLTPTDKEGASQRLNEMMKVKDFLMGYQSMFEELLSYMDEADQTNPLVVRLNEMVGLINGVRNNYIKTITPDIVDMLGDVFNKDLLNNIKREYNELIAAARTRGDEKRAKELKEERDNLPSQKVIEELLKGNKGDVGWFFGKLMATISNPDIILAGAAKKLKASLDRVRIQNKELRDTLSKEFMNRAKVYGRGMDIKAINESLVYTVEETNSKGEKMNVMYFKSEFDEKLYADHAKLQDDIRKALEEKDKDKLKEAKNKLRDFEKKYMQTGLTDEYYRLTKPLDVTVMYQGRQMTVRDIENQIRENIANIERIYTDDDKNNGKFDDAHLKELQILNEQKAELREKLDSTGKPKTGDALKIAEALQEYDKNKRKLYESVENTEYFNRAKEKAKIQYGEGSEEYQKWLSNNTRLVVSDEYYTEMDRLLKEKAELTKSISSQELTDLYAELRTITAPYKDKDGFIKGYMISETTANKIKDIQDKISELQKKAEYSLVSGYTREERDRVNAIYYLKNNGLPYSKRELDDIQDAANQRLAKRMADDPDYDAKVEKMKELNAKLYAMNNKVKTKYYHEELEKRERDFADAMGYTYNELKKDKDKYDQFKQSEWFQKNHIINTKIVYEDEATGETREALYETPTFQWMRSVPVEKYIEEKPAIHYSKSVLRESYMNENDKEVFIQTKDNLDVQNRFKPKTNEQYRKEYGKDHPYLNKDFASLKEKYNNKTATEKERTDYENLLYIHKQMIESQQNIEVSQRLGLAVPFLEKKGFERTVESGGKNLKEGAQSKMESLWEGVKRSWTRTEQDVDQEGIPEAGEVSRLATMDNNQVKFVPVRYSTKGNADNASYDVWASVLNYVGSINRKSELEKELAFVNGLEEILGEPANQPKSEERNMILNNIYKKYIPDLEAKINMGGNTRLEVLKSFINSIMYNEEYFPGYDVLGVNTQKAISNVMKFTSFSILGAAPFNWTVNWLSGNIQNMVEAAGGRNYTFKQFTDAKMDIYTGGKYGSAIKDMQSDYVQGKVGMLSFWGQMMEIFDPIQGEFENEFGKMTSFNLAKNIFNQGVYAGKIWGEWEIQMSSFIAFMKNHRVHNGKIVDKETFITSRVGTDVEDMSLKDISAKKLEALNEWNKLDVNLLDIFEMGKDGKLGVKDAYKDTFEVGSSEFSDIVAKLHAMQKKLNGSYAKFDKTYAEKTSIGRMMFFFRKYFIPLGVARWGQRRVDYESMNIEQGFYLTFLQTMGKDLAKFRFKAIYDWSNYSDKEKEAIRKTLVDVAIVMAIIMTYSLLLGFDPDDKDRMKKLREKGWAAQAAVFILLKLKSETEQFMPMTGIQEVNRVYTNPSLIFSETTQYINIANLMAQHGLDLLPGTDFNSSLYYQKKASEATLFGLTTLKDEGDSKLFAQLASLAGYTGKTFHPDEMVKSFEYSQKLK